MVSGEPALVLTDAKIKAAKPKEAAYKLADSGQLYLYVSTTGGRHWRMNYAYGRSARNPEKPGQKTLSFGSYPAVTLVEARRKRDEAKDLLRQGLDPAVERRVAVQTRTTANENTFQAVATAWFAKKKVGWAPRHAEKVWASLAEDVLPAIGALPITTIRAPRLLDLLTVVEERGAIETAHRIRQRISAVFVYGIAAGLVETDPAGSLGKALSEKPRARKQPSIIDGLRDQHARLTAVRQMLIDCEAERCRAATKLALRFLALTAVRPGELRLAQWAELEDIAPRWGVKAGARVQINEPLWRIPAARMKGDEDRKAEEGGDHLVPLSRQAVEVIEALRPLTGHIKLMFPSERHLHVPISENTLRQLLIRAGYYQRHVPHGFRAAFSTIMNERPIAPDGRHDGDRAVVDLMLAHVPKDKVESAYNRAEFMPRRRVLAQEWADMLLGDFWPPEVHAGQPIRWAATGAGRP